MLTVILHEKIESAGIKYVQDKIQAMCTDKNIPYSVALWELFWSYFGNAWLKM
ncbi:hypothetical protein PC116_g6078 [Phytophthora cactorum]|nr:hypothetical protein Pcac1_g23822 [Phytophthora cactorum]KAG2926745.1 hypothetical protein PC114_g3718 [Phytophthora cactorum]KAG3040873.1 hypothetical protein PC119_g1132 [Phytophthora cactorum]KAG4058535.1 hypothetical protein PC123_g6513 [Phytophthora cactorum]KAG4246178.1 hypothetical protein PC116_g6078 [Phytophthora cactorum]